MTSGRRAFREARALITAIRDCAARQAVASLAVTILLGATEGVGLLLLIPLLQLVGVDTGAPALGRMADAISRALGTVGLHPTLPAVLAVYVLVISAQSVLRWRQRALSTAVQQSLGAGLRTRVYAAIAGSQWAFLAGQRASDALHVLTAEIERVMTAAYFLLDIMASGLTTLVYVALALRVSPLMTTFVLSLGACLALFARGPLARARTSGAQLSQATSRFYAAITEHLAGMKLAKGYGVEQRHAAIFRALTADVSRETVAGSSHYARLQGQIAVGSAIALAVIVYVGHTVLRMSTTELLFLLFLFARLVPRLTGLYERWQALAGAMPAFAVVMDLEARCRDAAEPAGGDLAPIALTQRIRVDRVTFSYLGGDAKPAVDHVSLSIDAGTTVAIVGASGSGKSTLGDVLMGLLTPASGRILVDGIPIGPSTLPAWRAQIGLVPQDTFLFHETVRANLAWANPAASDGDLETALRLAAADEFVAALPQRLDTIVGDRGVLLSGGERQRLSLARALLRHPALLILDEATSALDSENETRICRAIDNLHHRMTIVAITHRLSMVRGADMIHVMDQGRLVESGTWSELFVRSGGRFRELCLAQGLTGAPEANRERRAIVG